MENIIYLYSALFQVSSVAVHDLALTILKIGDILPCNCTGACGAERALSLGFEKIPLMAEIKA